MSTTFDNNHIGDSSNIYSENHYGLPFRFAASPLCELECLSPNGSTMSFSLTSPPCHISFDVTSPLTDYKTVTEILNMTISPSVFSPKEFSFPKLLKKRDYHANSLDYSPTSNGNSHMDHLLSTSIELLPATPQANCLPVITPETVNHNVAPGSQLKSSSKTATKSNGTSHKSVAFNPVSPSVSCNCRKSKCLKLYCDCFSALSFCDSSVCNCIDCANNKSNDALRTEAIRATKDRNASAFQTKIEKKGHATGCHCKNSHCLKKYCECFTGNAFCGLNCKCQSCQNFKGSTDLEQAKFICRDIVVSDTDSMNTKRRKLTDRVSFRNVEESPSPISKIALLSENSMDNKATEGVHEESVVDRNLSESVKSLSDSLISDDQKIHSSPDAKGICYSFFGKNLPNIPKVTALKCLDYLSGGEIYAVSQVSTKWALVAVDDALWE